MRLFFFEGFPKLLHTIWENFPIGQRQKLFLYICMQQNSLMLFLLFLLWWVWYEQGEATHHDPAPSSGNIKHHQSRLTYLNSEKLILPSPFLSTVSIISSISCINIQIRKLIFIRSIWISFYDFYDLYFWTLKL